MLKSCNKIDLLSKAHLTLLPSLSYHSWQEVVGPADLMFHGQNKWLLQQLSAGRFPFWSFNGPLLYYEIGPCRPCKYCPEQNELPSL